MVKEAELHADEDKKKKELVEARNQADSLIYQTEKSIKELGDKVDATLKTNLEGVMERLKKAMEGTDTEEIQKLSEELMQASHKLAEAMYAQASAAGQAGDESAEAGGPSAQAESRPPTDEDVVDADFEEVKDDKKS